MPRGMELHRFPGASGVELAARMEHPAGDQPFGYALLAHCFTCSKDYKSMRRLSETLAGEGIAVLSFDFTGLGESEGEFADTNFSSNLDDLVAAADFMRREHRAPDVLIGHSLGGAAVLAAAHRIPETRLVATIAAPSETESLLEKLGPVAEEAERRGEALAVIAGRTFSIRRQLVEDLRRQKLEEHIARLGKPLLIFHSPSDSTVSIEHARRIYQAARHPKSFISLNAADHLLQDDPRDARLVGEVTAACARRYLT